MPGFELHAMPQDDVVVLRRSFEQILSGLEQIRGEVALLKIGQADLAREVHEIDMEVGGSPSLNTRPEERSSIRDRIHALESDAKARQMMADALAEVKRGQARAWSRYQKIGLFLFTGIGAIGAILKIGHVLGL